MEKDGYFYGRGTIDMKDGDAIMVATLLRMKQEGYRPDRDIILALTADEEGGSCQRGAWLLKNHRELVDAEFAINLTTGRFATEHGKRSGPQARMRPRRSMPTFSSRSPTPAATAPSRVADNAIYSLTRAGNRFAAYEFPFELNAVTRAYYERRAAVETGQRAADMRASSRTPPDPQAIRRLTRTPPDRWITHTTCVRHPPRRQGTPTTRCRSAPRPYSTAAFFPDIPPRKCASG